MELTLLGLFATGLGAGVIGAVLGVGGGIIIVPVLTLAFGYDIRIAVASSLVAVVASSTAAGSVYLGRGLTHLKLAMLLETTTTMGAIAGGLIAMFISPDVVTGIFGFLLIMISALMFRRSPVLATDAIEAPTTAEPYTMTGSYLDLFENKLILFTIRRIPFGLAASFFAGSLSGMLGVGGGFIKVPVMNLAMNVPMKVATATSNFMIGVTAISSLFIYWGSDYLQPLIACPVALGVVAGALFGAKVSQKFSPEMLKRIFAGLLLVVSLQMILKSFGVFGV